MKNKLQQMILATFTFALICYVLYYTLGSLVILRIIIQTIAILTSIYLIFIDKRAATSKFAWLFAIFIFPYIGILFFFLFGNDPRSRRFSKVQQRNEQMLTQHVESILHRSPQFINNCNDVSKELSFLSGNQPLNCNQLDSIADGQSAYQELLKDIKQAKHHIHLMYFIYKDDETGRELADLLINKSKEGVAVRFMYDSVGSIKLSYDLIDELKSAGVAVKAYDLVNSPLLSTRINWRNHRKMVIIDGEIAHIGGMNIGNEYLSKTNKFVYWRDTNLRIYGPAVIEVQYVFLFDWIFLDEKESALNNFIENATSYFPIQKFNNLQGDETCQILFGGPYDEERILRDSLMEIFGKATKSIKIATPYFVPDEESLSVIRRAARCGLQVQLIIPGKGDRAISYYGNMAFVERLLKAGVEVYAYDETSFLHCKYMLVDDEIATIGSTNFDIRSFNINHEISAFIYGPSPCVNNIQKQFEKDLENSKQLTMEMLEQRSLSTHLKERLSEFFTPLL